MKACVVIPTLDARDMLAEVLESLETQTVSVDVVVVDNASTDGTGGMVATRYPRVKLVTTSHNLGFGKAVNLGVAAAPTSTEAIVLVNNDVVCEPQFVERILAPLVDERVGMVAGVLLQGSAPASIDSAGIELDRTMRAYAALWNEPVETVSAAPTPFGACGGAAAYRLSAFREIGGFDPAFFAYWEDVDLALRLRLAGWECALASDARALHGHGQTLGAGSPRSRSLDSFGRGFVLARYRVAERRPLTHAAVALLDWPALLAHVVARRELEPIRARLAARAPAACGPRFAPRPSSRPCRSGTRLPASGGSSGCASPGARLATSRRRKEPPVRASARARRSPCGVRVRPTART